MHIYVSSLWSDAYMFPGTSPREDGTEFIASGVVCFKQWRVVNIRQTCEQKAACVHVSGTNWGAMSACWQEGSSEITIRRVDKGCRAPQASFHGPWRQELSLIRGVALKFQRLCDGRRSGSASCLVEGVEQQFDSKNNCVTENPPEPRWALEQWSVLKSCCLK